MRSVMVIISLVLAWKFLILIGILDHWFNFRTKFKKIKKNEGDKL